MGVIGIRARFRIWFAARSVVLIAILVLLLAAIFAGVITGLTVKSVCAALLAGAFVMRLRYTKCFSKISGAGSRPTYCCRIDANIHLLNDDKHHDFSQGTGVDMGSGTL